MLMETTPLPKSDRKRVATIAYRQCQQKPIVKHVYSDAGDARAVLVNALRDVARHGKQHAGGTLRLFSEWHGWQIKHDATPVDLLKLADTLNSTATVA